MYYLEMAWHFIYSVFYYCFVALGWVLEMTLIFVTFFLAGMFLSGRC